MAVTWPSVIPFWICSKLARVRFDEPAGEAVAFVD